MCNFFSLVSDGNGKIMYFDWELRQRCLSGDLKKLSYNPDSHTSIADYFGYKGKDEDKLNKYEYNPMTKKFVVDQINTTDDRKEVKELCKKLIFKTIIPQLIIKPIINPFNLKPQEVTQQDIDNLHKWASVWASVGDSVWDSVGDSVRDSVWASVRDSVWASVWAYTSSFIDIEYKYDFTPCIELWERGFVPSFYGKTWILHNANGIVYKEVK